LSESRSESENHFFFVYPCNLQMPLDELVDIVDPSDRVLYATTLKECKEKGLLHRAVATFLRSSNKDILLQRRSESDVWLPGKWTISSTGHIKSGEDPIFSAVREAKEELGLDVTPSFKFKLVLPKFEWLGKFEHEIAYAFEATSDSSIQVNCEVEEVKFLSPNECHHLILEHPEELTPDAVILFKKYLERPV
jgi:isopentenyl-diphosphate Delta-isomerase